MWLLRSYKDLGPLRAALRTRLTIPRASIYSTSSSGSRACRLGGASATGPPAKNAASSASVRVRVVCSEAMTRRPARPVSAGGGVSASTYGVR